jgi:hypothetical protein
VREKLFERWRPTGLPGVEASSYGRIRKNGKLTTAKQIQGQYRHRLICRAWHGPANGRHVRRKRGRSDHPSNLYWSTRAVIATTSANPRFGQRHGMAKLKTWQVKAIIASDEPLSILSTRFKISKSQCSLIRLNKAWRHLLR